MLTSPMRSKGYLARMAFACFTASASLMVSQAPIGAGQISGTIADLNGFPIAGAVVVIRSGTEAGEARRTATDGDGRYLFNGMHPGPYKLSASRVGYLDSEPRDVVLGAASVRFDITLIGAEAARPRSTTARQNQDSPPNFSVSGAHGSTAPSGYSTGLSAEERAQVRASALNTPLFETFLDASAIDCSQEPLLLRELDRAPAAFSMNHALGKLYLDEGSYAKAVPYLEAAHLVNAEELDNSLDLALAYIAVGRGTNAVSVLEQNAKGHSSDPKYLRLMAFAYSSAGDSGKSVLTLRKAAAIDPSTDNQYNCGIEFIQLGELKEAHDLFEKETTADARSSRLWFGLGITEHLLDHKQEAISALFRSADADPDSVRPLMVLAEMTGLTDDRRSELRGRLARLLAAQPNDAEAHFAYALLMSRGQAEDADSRQDARLHLLRALELKPNMAQSHFLLGQIESEADHVQKAIEQFVEGLKIAPGNSQAHYRLSLLYRHAGQLDAAREEIKYFRELHKNPGEVESGDSVNVTGMLIQPAANRRACGL